MYKIYTVEEATFNKPLVILLLIAGMLFSVVGATFKIMHYPYEMTFLIAGLVATFALQLYIIIDVVKNKLSAKWILIIALLFFSTITSIYYLLRRDDLIKETK